MPTITQREAKAMGIPKNTIQTIEMSKRKFNVISARKWLKDHNYVNSYFRKTRNFIRFMQVFPIKDAKYHSMAIDDGNIIIVYQEYV